MCAPQSAMGGKLLVAPLLKTYSLNCHGFYIDIFTLMQEFTYY